MYARRANKQDASVISHRDKTRTGCMACMMVNLKANGKFYVTEFCDDHNDPLASSDEAHMLRSRRKVTPAQAALADDCEKYGIRSKNTHELLCRQAGGWEKVGFLPVDYKNYLRTKRMKSMEMSDAEGLLEYFKRKQVEDPMFFQSILLDYDGCITNIFWVDGRMKVDYECFGDVVCFDTTYKTNDYGLPFALFVGVNHHKNSVVFGASLLYDETIESLGWLFITFCHAMSNKEPVTILTDQCVAMAAAIRAVLPRTKHRICVWHMFQNALKTLSQVFKGSKTFLNDFSNCIYDYEEEEEFLGAWDKMLEKYDLHGNPWLKKIFEDKEKWALVYGKNTFSVDMMSTQRSETMNKDLKAYLDPKNNVIKIFHHFERLLEDK